MRLAGVWFVPAIVLVGVFAAGVHLTKNFEGCFGIGLAVVSGLLVVLGLFLFYKLSVDRVNIGYINRYVVNGARAEDGAVIAIEGRAEVEGEPMTSPFSGTKCAAYVYMVQEEVRISRSQGGDHKKMVKIARGFHMLPTTISGSTLSLSLGSLPSFEDDMREEESERKWGDGWNRLIETATEPARDPNSLALEAELLKLRETHVREAHQDYVTGTKVEGTGGGSASSMMRDQAESRGLDPQQREKLERVAAALESGSGFLTMQEEVLPVGETCCFIGRYDAQSRAIDGLKSRIGPNLMVYRGTGREVVERVGGATRKGMIAAVVMLLIGGAILSLPWWPASIIEQIPGL